ncbi:unnamed protein product [Paramecium pentaurelia]|uniref:Uncharacterized protein n=1 Tax=Paramecium pentaurelia TaxID=43138 RepID=A0A8S1X0K3_9CILI|nr:unnamed protein product [Paramecium pentaurelia]
MFSTDPRFQQQFGQQTNQIQISPRQNQFVQSPRQFQQSPRQFQQSPRYNNAQMISPQQKQLIGSPQSQQLKQLQLQQSPIMPTSMKQQNPINIQNPKNIRSTNQPQNIAQTQSPKTAQPQKQVQEFRHVERPLQVITADEIEAPWRLKCSALERQILELQIQIRKDNGKIIEENVQEVQDDTKVKNLQNQKQELEKKISDDEEFIQQQRQKLEELQQEYEITITEKISYASNEVETWIKKYSNLEKNYNDSQQKIQNLKKQLAQVEAADKAIQDQKRMETKQEVRKSSKMY